MIDIHSCTWNDRKAIENRKWGKETDEEYMTLCYPCRLRKNRPEEWADQASKKCNNVLYYLEQWQQQTKQRQKVRESWWWSSRPNIKTNKNNTWRRRRWWWSRMFCFCIFSIRKNQLSHHRIQYTLRQAKPGFTSHHTLCFCIDSGSQVNIACVQMYNYLILWGSPKRRKIVTLYIQHYSNECM